MSTPSSLLGGVGEDRRARDRGVLEQAVGLVGAQGVRMGDDVAVAADALELGDQVGHGDDGTLPPCRSPR
jgi:hypothetical protein